MIQGFLLGMLSVILGAFAAHALEDILDLKALAFFKTAIYYMMIHSIVLILVGMAEEFSLKQKRVLQRLFSLGILLFTGSICAYYLLPLIGLQANWVIALTPVGGLFFIIGWGFGAFALYKSE